MNPFNFTIGNPFKEYSLRCFKQDPARPAGGSRSARKRAPRLLLPESIDLTGGMMPLRDTTLQANSLEWV